MKPRLTREGDVLVVNLAGIGKTAFEDALPKVKAIEGRRYNPQRKVWEFPAKPMTAHRLIHQVGAQPSSDVLRWVREEMAKQADEVVTRLPKAGPNSVPFADKLYPFQRDGVAFMADKRRVLLADDMGLGKTVQAIATVEKTYNFQALLPVLVIAPNSMVGRWAAEIRSWLPRVPVFVIDGRKTAAKRRQQLEEALRVPGAWIVVNWEQIRAQKRETGRAKPKYEWAMKEPLFAQVQWAAVIADEAHRAKNRYAQQTRGLWQLDAPVKLALTGTPILNSPDEIWALLAWLRPDVYGEYSRGKIGYEAFFRDYVEFSESYYGGHRVKVVTGVKNADALRFELADKLVRRTKGQVLDLPAKSRTIIPVQLTSKQRAMYQDAESGLFFEIEAALESLPEGELRSKIAAALEMGDVPRLAVLVPNAAARVMRLRQITSSPALLGGPDESAKLDAAVEIITDNAGRPFVVFTKFKGTVALLAERLRRRKLDVLTMTGDTPPEDRTALVQRFQEGEADVFIATIEAGGVGLTLTAADTAIFLEREWVPGVNEQAEDRLHRIGQKNAVSILILEAQDTVDTERIAPTNRMKELIVSSVVTQDRINEEVRSAE